MKMVCSDWPAAIDIAKFEANNVPYDLRENKSTTPIDANANCKNNSKVIDIVFATESI